MSSDDYVPARPLSVMIPNAAGGAHGPYCPRRPNLTEILANTAAPPWTLSAFMAYLSSNHCLETLEFVMDAGRYKKHYNKMLTKAVPGELPPARDREYVRSLWSQLTDAYIKPNGSREVNIPSNVRDPIINVSQSELPPAPETLDPAVSKIYELMEDSVLVPFLNSVYPQSPGQLVNTCYNSSTENISVASSSLEDRQSYFSSRTATQQSQGQRQRNARPSPPPPSTVEPHAHSYSAPSHLNRKSAPSNLTTAINRFSTKLSPTSSAPAATITSATSGGSTITAVEGASAGLTDDSGSTDSPSQGSPTTPPAILSPQTTEVESPRGSWNGPKSALSTRDSRDSGTWQKKLGRLSGWSRMGMRKKSRDFDGPSQKKQEVEEGE